VVRRRRGLRCAGEEVPGLGHGVADRRDEILPASTCVCGREADLVLDLLRWAGYQLPLLGCRHGYGRSTSASSSVSSSLSSSHSRSALPSPAATAVAVSFQLVSSAIAR